MTVVGLGPMGQAMVRAFLDAGVRVTVWNRTAARADAVVELGAERAATVAEALDANEVIVLSLTHYAAMYDVLGQAEGRLSGKVVVNASSDSPADTRAGAAWVRERGGRFLAAGVMAQPEGLALPASYIFYSGPREVFEEHRELLDLLASHEYLGDDDGLAQLYYQAVYAAFLPWFLGIEQAFAMIDRAGDDIGRFLPFAQRAMHDAEDFYAAMASAARAGGWGDLGNLRMMAAGAAHVVETGDDLGVDTSLLRSARAIWDRALAESERAGEPVPTYQLLRGAVE
ncbi:NAD(P)-binding domain-containing protein [Nocardia sp. NPDC050713]|uniref:NAD(P)-dependent oxidoreductase n=1 Tax=Nocardia sp. NPDC050713 TaxID=3154511 RepID=UPI0033E06236